MIFGSAFGTHTILLNGATGTWVNDFGGYSGQLPDAPVVSFEAGDCQKDFH